MNANTIQIPIQSVMREVTLNVEITGVTSLKIRSAVARWLICVAAKVLGVPVSITFKRNT